MNDPLDGLIVDAREVDRERLASCLAGRVAVDGETGQLVLLEGFQNLQQAKLQILLYLLGRKAARLLDRIDTEAVPRKEVAEATGIPVGTVGRVVRELADDRLVSQDANKRYFVPSHQLSRIQRILSEVA